MARRGYPPEFRRRVALILQYLGQGPFALPQHRVEVQHAVLQLVSGRHQRCDGRAGP